MTTKDQSDNLDRVIQEEKNEISISLIRSSAALAKERIHEISTSSSKRRASVLDEKERVEEDGIYIGSCKESVGTLIKKGALNLYEDYHGLGCAEKSIVALGLNSIIDLSHFSAPQKDLFSESDWKILRSKYTKRFSPGIIIDHRLEKKITEIEMVSKQEIEKGRFLSYLKESKAKSRIYSDVFSIYSQYLELMEFHTYVFNKDIDTTEADVVVKIWSPMLERLFRREQLRTKWGETVGDSGDISDNSGFKVDLRVVKDTLSRRRKEADKANCEISRINPGLVKITNDRTKLLIESKVVLDKIVEEDPEKAKEISVPALQLIGNQAILYSLSLAANGVYVSVREGSATVPNFISNMKGFRDVILLLFKFKAATTNVLAFNLKGGCDSNNNNSDDGSSSSNNTNNNNNNNNNNIIIGSSSSSINNNSNNNNNINCALWVRDTWIPPNSERKSRLPSIPHVLYRN